ncbi:MAG: AMP-binding protein [Acidimicrobiia bacterium]
MKGVFADHVKARAGDPNVALLFEDESWTYAEWVRACSARAALFVAMRIDGAPHIGLMLDNVPDFSMWSGAAAMCGATIVGINPTRRGAGLERDIDHTECQLIVTETRYLELLDGLDLGAADGRVLVIDEPSYDDVVEPFTDAPLPTATVKPSDQIFLLFTSGTTGAPKAVVCSQERLDRIATTMATTLKLQPTDVTYASMPLFHSNALFTAWSPTIVAGAAMALRRRFSASAFLSDVRKYGATYFNYVGKPLAYILDTPEHTDDADNPLVRGFGNEGNEADMRRFEARFACPLTDGYGQTETGATISRVPGTPVGSLGKGSDAVKVINPETGEECPPARFDTNGRLLNAEEATGEIVNLAAQGFEGYWKNAEAMRERYRDGAYWTGDLAYRDDEGFFYFAGRTADWIRVDGENFAAAPVERILLRWEPVVLPAVYGVPDAEVGDRVMAAIQLAPGVAFDPDAFVDFLAEQHDLGTKWAPTFVRIVGRLPVTETNKILKRQLVHERWSVGDPIWWRPGRELAYVPFTPDDASALREQFAAAGRSHVLEAT